MASSSITHFQNDQGVGEIKVGVKEFMCCGASEPHDHPHVFLDMGTDNQVICPYCSTLFTHHGKLAADATIPEGCVVSHT